MGSSVRGAGKPPQVWLGGRRVWCWEATGRQDVGQQLVRCWPAVAGTQGSGLLTSWASCPCPLPAVCWKVRHTGAQA